MARKRLSDLLREEAGKPQPSQEPPPAAAAGTRARTTRKTAPPKASAAIEGTDAATTEPPAAAVVAEVVPEVASEGTSVNDTQERAITELKAALDVTRQTAQQRESDLQQQVADLHAQLEAQDERIKTLQTEAQRISQLKAELEAAKTMILQLSEVNAKPESPKPTATTPATTTRQETAKPAASRPTAPSPQAVEPGLESRPLSAAGHAPSQHQLALRRILEHPVQPSKPPVTSDPESRLTDTDMGWVD